MISILVFVALIAGLVLMRRRPRSIGSSPLPDADGWVRNEFPDGTIEEQQPDGRVVYSFENGDGVTIEQDGTVYRNESGVRTVIAPYISPKYSSTGAVLDRLGMLFTPSSVEVYTFSLPHQQQWFKALEDQDFDRVLDIQQQLETEKHSLDLAEAYSALLLSNNTPAVHFLTTALGYTPPVEVLENTAIAALERKPTSLDVPDEPLATLLANPTWVSNATLATAIARRRYDALVPLLRHCSDTRTFSERMCLHAQNGDQVVLQFIPQAPSATKALALYVAARSNHPDIAKSILRSFSPEQQKGLKKMFSRLQNEPNQVLAIFA